MVSETMNAEKMSKGKFKGPVRFYDGRHGMARQDFESIDNPRFGYAWKRENRNDRGRQWWMVDGTEVADFAEADRLLSLPPDPNSPDEVRRRQFAELDNAPKINGCYNALSEAKCNADAGPFGPLRASMQRMGHGWHVGLNRHSDSERKAGREFNHGLYNAKTAAFELHRGMYLFESDRTTPGGTGLKCALGKRCDKCPILREIGNAIVETRDAERFGRPEIEDFDIDAAKVLTCISHILQEQPNGFFDGAFFSTKADKEPSQ